MNNEKLGKLMKDESFLKKILVIKTPEEIKEAFAKKGVEISFEEIELLGDLTNKSIKEGKKKLTEDDLHEVTGGVYGIKDIYSYGESCATGIATGIIAGAVYPLAGPIVTAGGVVTRDPKMVTLGIGVTVGFAGSLAATIGIYEGIKWKSKKIINALKKIKNKK